VQIDWNNGYKIVQTDANTVRLYNFSGESQELRLDAVVFGADLAEYYTVDDQTIGAGDVVSMTGNLDDYQVPILRRSNGVNDPQLAGIISTKAGLTLGLEDENRRLLALAGRVPVKIASDSPVIESGDMITSSSIEGHAKKATLGQRTIGKALENWTPENGKETILVLVGNSISFPQVEKITDFTIAQISTLPSLPYRLVDSTGEIIENTATYSQALIADLQAGVINSEKIVSPIAEFKDLYVSEKIKSPIIETTDIEASGEAKLDTIATNEIKPENQDLTINLNDKIASDSPTSDKGDLAKLVIKGLEGKTVTTIDAAGNASFSGQITADSINASSSSFLSSTINDLSSNNASVSGKLIAGEIESNTINSLSSIINHQSSSIQDLGSNINDIQQLLADIRNNPAPDPDNYQILDDRSLILDINEVNAQTSNIQDLRSNDLTVSGNSNMYNLSVSGSLLTGNTLYEQNTITSLASELKLSALARVNFFDGAVTIARDGTITTQGELIAKGGIKTDSLSPIGSDTLDIEGNLRLSGDLILDKYLTATDSSSIIAAPDNFLQNGIFAPAIDTATSSAGIALLPGDSQEVIVYNNNIRKDSLIYLTPASDFAADQQLSVVKKEDCSEQLYNNGILEQCKKYFKVVSSDVISWPIKFNWLIIN